VTRERIAEARCKIDMARLLTLKAAWMMDTVAGNKVAKTEIAMIKVVAPSMACQVIDWAMQVHGGGGMSDDFPLAYAYAGARTLRFADGPDEVHRNADRQDGTGQDRVRSVSASERRLQRLASRSAQDKRISYGCINAPEAFYNQWIDPLFGRSSGVAYVLPDTEPFASIFIAASAYP
jgi:hypothetical protein